MGRSRSLNEVYEQIGQEVVDIDLRWLATHQRAALERAYFRCLPLGIRSEIVAVGAGDEWRIEDHVCGLIERCRITNTARGIPQHQEVAPPALRVSMDHTGVTRVRFPQVLPASTLVEIQALIQPPLPSDAQAEQLIAFPWPELIVTYAVAELYAMLLDQGASLDMTQADVLRTSWSMEGDAQKRTILQSLGLMQPEEDAPKKKAKRD